MSDLEIFLLPITKAENQKAYNEIYYQGNKEKSKVYYQRNKKKLKADAKAYRHRNKAKVKANKKAYDQKNKDKRKVYTKIYYEENKEKLKAERKIYYQKNKEKEKERRKINYRNVKEKHKWVSDLKRTKGCLRCEENDPVCLDFDHIDPTTKEYNVASMVVRNLSREAIETEIAKCQILCANCHRKKTANDRLE